MFINFILLTMVLTALYLLAIMPKLKLNPELKKFDGWFYAHRGFHDNTSNRPENSIPAFLAAVQNQYGIELDVQLTKDQIPVVFHDGNLLRACGVKDKVSELTYQELSTYRLFQSQERIPTFEEVLNVIGGRVPLIIELKIPWHAKPLCKKVSEILRGYQGDYCIESFNPFGLMWYRKNHPKVVRGQLSTDFVKEKIEGSKVQYFILKNLLMNFLTKPDFIAYDHQYVRGLSITICRKLYRIKTVAWTIRSQKELDQNQKVFDWFIFENFKPKKMLQNI